MMATNLQKMGNFSFPILLLQDGVKLTPTDSTWGLKFFWVLALSKEFNAKES